MKLMSEAQSNAKLAKTLDKHNVIIGSLTLRPADLSGYNVCPWASDGCKAACVLEFAGRSSFHNIRDSRAAKTRRFFEDRVNFVADLKSDLAFLVRKGKRLGLDVYVRLNVASDIAWEKEVPELFTEFPTIKFYDYTKGIHRLLKGSLPANYQLTYSWNENSKPHQVAKVLDKGMNVTCVFDTHYSHARIDELPESYELGGKSYGVVDGDESDLRHTDFDGKGVIVGLHGKGGKARVIEGVESGFILPTIGGVSMKKEEKVLTV